MRLTKPKVMQLHTLLMFTLAERDTITYNQPHTRAEAERERERWQQSMQAKRLKDIRWKVEMVSTAMPTTRRTR